MYTYTSQLFYLRGATGNHMYNRSAHMGQIRIQEPGKPKN